MLCECGQAVVGVLYTVVVDMMVLDVNVVMDGVANGCVAIRLM